METIKKNIKKYFKTFLENIRLFLIFGTTKKDVGTSEYLNVLKNNKQNLKDVKAMRSLLKNIVIPENWNVLVSTTYWSSILIIHHDTIKEDNVFKNFNYLCEQVSKYGKIKKEFNGDYSSSLSIDGIAERVKYKNCTFLIKICQLQVDKCDIEWKEVTVKKAVMSGICKEILSN
jgi:hypothetical protein